MKMALLLLAVCSVACGNGDLRTAGLTNLAEGAVVEASSSAARPGVKYGPDSATDGDMNTWWASNSFPRFPVSLTVRFAAPTTLDTVAFVQPRMPNLYSNWKAVRVEFPDGTSVEEELEDSSAPRVLRFERREVEWLRLVIPEPHHPDRHYVGLREVMAFNDPERKVGIKMPPAETWKQADLTPRGRAQHPCVYITPDDVARARERLAAEEWVQRWFAGVRRQADEWVAREDEWIASIVPEHGACFAYGFTGCPICRASWGTWGGVRASFDNPGHVTCAGGHVLPDEAHPDPGTGYVGADGRIHYFVGSYNAWVVETLQFKALANLALAYTLTGEERYAQKAAVILDALADIYPSCDAGSWDYPSTPPSGRFNRPWYQVARVLVHFVDWYDQVYHSPSLDEPSVREGLTRRENIELNLMRNGAEYCYTESFKGGLHNGQADYVRGSLAVGCLLDIPHYIDWAYDGPYGILNLVRNNVDRDGRYFETSTMYADHTRSLYLTFAEPLFNYRSEKYPEGINLHDDGQFQTFYVLPQLGFNCLGKSPRFGDSGPDTGRSFLPARLSSDFDYRLAERLFSRTSDAEARGKFGALLMYLSDGDPGRARETRGEMPWVLFHGRDAGEAPVGAVGAGLPDALHRRISRTDFFGQKGIALLRAGEGHDAQAALVRWGPSLNHGHLDDLNLNYYALGYEVTYDLGYGLGSTHTQVGWAKQTASHNLVLVDETPQRRDGSGSGGSLHLLADLPGLQLTEASSDNSYAQQGVSAYRRLVALVGEGPDTYLVDLFRVEGGTQHDYLFHALGEEAEFEGVVLGEAEEGSLAGPEFRWGALQLNDGDMEGHPNRPYWNPPPGNGLGFLMEPQRGVPDGPWRATWTLPSNDAFVQLVMPAQPDTEVITAWAPGILPRNPRARHAVARRRAQDDAGLSSVFIAAIAPYGERIDGTRMDAAQIHAAATVSAGELKHLGALGTLLFQAAQGDELTWSFEVPEAGEYVVAVEHYRSPSYGQAQLLVDGAEVGEALVGTHGDVQQAPLARLGTRRLEAGAHTATLRLVADDGAGNFWFGIRALWLIPADRAETTVARSPIREVLRAVCDDEEGPVRPAGVLVTLEPDGRVADLLLSAGDAERLRSFRAGPHQASFRGRFAHVRFVDGQPVAANLVGAAELTVGELEVRASAEHAGTVRDVDAARGVVETDTALQAGALVGQVIMFDNPRYSRSTAHRIARIERQGAGTRIHLESPTLILGSGILDDDPLSATQFTSLLAHEYARHDSATGTQFLSGKRIKGEGFSTLIERTNFGQLMRYTVESTEGMGAGDEFVICDVQAGDRFLIPTILRIERQADGTFGVGPGSTTGATVQGNVWF